jgi:hypothetical protein
MGRFTVGAVVVAPCAIASGVAKGAMAPVVMCANAAEPEPRIVPRTKRFRLGNTDPAPPAQEDVAAPTWSEIIF